MLVGGGAGGGWWWFGKRCGVSECRGHCGRSFRTRPCHRATTSPTHPVPLSPPNTIEISAYNTLLCGFVRVGDLTMARAVLDKARREGARPDAVSYSAYAAGLAAVGRLDEAEELLGEMAEAEGLRPGAHVYGALLDGSVRVHVSLGGGRGTGRAAGLGWGKARQGDTEASTGGRRWPAGHDAGRDVGLGGLI